MSWIAQAAGIFVAVLREIFDEAGYARYLERAQVHGSRQAYAAFLRERESVTSRRPRCC
jgi:hypothetical protein